MVLSTAIDPLFHKLSFLTVSRQAELIGILVTGAESIRCNTAGCTILLNLPVLMMLLTPLMK